MAENDDTTDDQTQDDGHATEDATDWKVEARKWEQRAKENGAKAREFERAQQATMTDAERAVAEAEKRGRTAATTDFGKRLAQTQFDALAARRNPNYDSAKALKYLDLASLVSDDGEVDESAVAAAVADLVPEGQSKPPAFDGGPRTTSAGKSDMSSLIRKAAGLG